jgi:hypothetical protein
MKPDTYFFSPQEALRVASEQNRSDDLLQYFLQVCYYNGEKIQSDLVNLIHLPAESLIDDLACGTYRIPTSIDFTGMDISQYEKKDILEQMKTAITKASQYRDELNEVYKQKLRTAKLDFLEPLRIYIGANSRTRVMQYVARDIADAFIARGYNVYFELLLGIEDLGCRKKKLEFNPHVIININNFNNLSISDDVFHFIWFQDAMPILTNNKDINIQDRDFSFVYQSIFRELLIKKDFPKHKIIDQKIIPVNTNLFYLDDKIKREDKVVFVGTYYKNGEYFEALEESIDKKITTMVEEGISLSQENLQSV